MNAGTLTTRATTALHPDTEADRVPPCPRCDSGGRLAPLLTACCGRYVGAAYCRCKDGHKIAASDDADATAANSLAVLTRVAEGLEALRFPDEPYGPPPTMPNTVPTPSANREGDHWRRLAAAAVTR